MAGLGWLAAQQVRARVQRGLSTASPALLAGAGFATLIGMAAVSAVARSPLGFEARHATGVAGLSLVSAIGWAWITAAGRPAPAFSRSEIQWLITAPLRRRDLVAYRFAVTQPALVALAAVAGVASLPFGPLQALRVAIGTLLLLELALIGQLFAASAQARLASWGLGVLPRTLVAVCIVLGLWAAVFWGAPVPPDASEDPMLALDWLADAIVARPLLVAIAGLPIAGPMLPGLGLLLLAAAGMAVAGMVFDGPFEEHALLASRPADRGRALYPLAGHGPAWRAIAWRGATAVTRQAVRAAPAIAVMCVSVVFLVQARANSPRDREIQVFGAFILGLFALAPTFVQQDLHDDLRRGTWLRALPIRSLDLVRGAVVGGTLTMWPAHAAITVTAAFFVPSMPAAPDYSRPVVVLSLIAIEGACTYASFAMSNAMVVAWPRWLQHTGEEAAGLENVGRLVGATALRNSLLLPVMMPSAVAGGIAFALLFRVDPRLAAVAWAAVSTSLVLLFGEWVVRRTARRLDAPWDEA
ncbi:MAG: hypothetical protein EP330_04715 [Deltaproteobacteria bacterium]|nr:MAG: hypothetical protein EP330_04715 [Deltaproteobacteria bacterium]